jgi:hypothetical protein
MSSAAPRELESPTLQTVDHTKRGYCYLSLFLPECREEAVMFLGAFPALSAVQAALQPALMNKEEKFVLTATYGVGDSGKLEPVSYHVETTSESASVGVDEINSHDQHTSAPLGAGEANSKNQETLEPGFCYLAVFPPVCRVKAQEVLGAFPMCDQVQDLMEELAPDAGAVVGFDHEVLPQVENGITTWLGHIKAGLKPAAVVLCELSGLRLGGRKTVRASTATDGESVKRHSACNAKGHCSKYHLPSGVHCTHGEYVQAWELDGPVVNVSPEKLTSALFPGATSAPVAFSQQKENSKPVRAPKTQKLIAKNLAARSGVRKCHHCGEEGDCRPKTMRGACIRVILFHKGHWSCRRCVKELENVIECDSESPFGDDLYEITPRESGAKHRQLFSSLEETVSDSDSEEELSSAMASEPAPYKSIFSVEDMFAAQRKFEEKQKLDSLFLRSLIKDTDEHHNTKVVVKLPPTVRAITPEEVNAPKPVSSLRPTAEEFVPTARKSPQRWSITDAISETTRRNIERNREDGGLKSVRLWVRAEMKLWNKKARKDAFKFNKENGFVPGMDGYKRTGLPAHVVERRLRKCKPIAKKNGRSPVEELQCQVKTPTTWAEVAGTKSVVHSMNGGKDVCKTVESDSPAKQNWPETAALKQKKQQLEALKLVKEGGKDVALSISDALAQTAARNQGRSCVELSWTEGFLAAEARSEAREERRRVKDGNSWLFKHQPVSIKDAIKLSIARDRADIARRSGAVQALEAEGWYFFKKAYQQFRAAQAREERAKTPRPEKVFETSFKYSRDGISFSRREFKQQRHSAKLVDHERDVARKHSNARNKVHKIAC